MFEQIHERSAILHKALDGLVARQRATSHNLANADTPGYRSQEVRFEDQIKGMIKARSGQDADLAQTHKGHLSLKGPEDRPFPVEELFGRMRNDGNGVDLEQEVTRMAQAQMSYAALTQQLGGSFSSLKYVIAEGGR